MLHDNINDNISEITDIITGITDIMTSTFASAVGATRLQSGKSQ